MNRRDFVKLSALALASVGSKKLPSFSYRNVPPQLLQPNLIGQWNFSEGFSQTSFNRVNPTQALPKNLLGLPEGAFSGFSGNAFVWELGGGGTVTDLFAANPINGDITASRYVVTAGTKFLDQNIALPVGTYTFSMYVKSNTGSTQAVRLGCATGFPVLSGDLPVTTSWTRITFTATLSAPSTQVYFPQTDVAGDALDILIYGPQVELGSSATPYIPANLDAQLGLYGIADIYDPDWVATGLDFNGSVNKFLSAASALPTTTTNVTVYMVARWPNANSPRTINALIAENYDINRLSLVQTASHGTIAFNYSGQQLVAEMATLHDDNWHIIIGSYDGSTLRVYVDNVEVASVAISLSAVSLRQFIIGNISDAVASAWPGQIGMGAFYNIAHTVNQINQNVLAIQGIMACRSVVVDTLKNTRFVLYEGDSNTDFSAFTTSGYPYLSSRATALTVIARDEGVAGSKIQGNPIPNSNLNDRAAFDDALYNPNRKANILSVMIGTNDLAGGAITATQFLTNLKTYCLARKATGWKILIIPLPPCVSIAPSVRTAVINGILADNSYWDAVARTDTDPNIGCDTCFSNTTYYSDGIHWTLAAHAIAGPIVASAIQSIY